MYMYTIVYIPLYLGICAIEILNIPLKNKPTIKNLHSITGNHNRLKIMYGLGIFTTKWSCQRKFYLSIMPIVIREVKC